MMHQKEDKTRNSEEPKSPVQAVDRIKGQDYARGERWLRTILQGCGWGVVVSRAGNLGSLRERLRVIYALRSELYLMSEYPARMFAGIHAGSMTFETC